MPTKVSRAVGRFPAGRSAGSLLFPFAVEPMIQPSAQLRSYLCAHVPLALHELEGPLQGSGARLHGLHRHVVLHELPRSAFGPVLHDVLCLAKSPFGDRVHHPMGTKIVTD